MCAEFARFQIVVLHTHTHIHTYTAVNNDFRKYGTCMGRGARATKTLPTVFLTFRLSFRGVSEVEE